MMTQFGRIESQIEISLKRRQHMFREVLNQSYAI